MLSNMRIGKKLVGGFLVVAAMFACVGVFTIWQLWANDSEYSQKWTLSVDDQRQAAALTTGFLRLRLSVNRLMALESSSSLQSLKRDLADARQQLHDFMAEYERTIRFDEDRALFAEFKRAEQDYEADLDEVLTDLTQNRRDQAAKILTGDGLLHSQQVTAACDKMTQFNKKSAADMSDVMTARTSRVVVTIAVVLVLGLVTAIGVGLFLTRIITRPMRNITEIAERIAHGDVCQTIEYRSADEIGQLADSFRAMSKMIEERARVAEKLAAGDLTEQVEPASEKDVLAKSLVALTATLKDLKAETTRLTNMARDGQLSERGRSDHFRGAFSELIVGVNEMLDAILLPIGEANRVLQQIRCGNLRDRFQMECKGDHQKMRDSINGVHAWLTELIAYITNIANGDMTATMAKAGEQDQIHEWLVLLKQNIVKLRGELGSLLESARNGDLTKHGNAAQFKGAYAELLSGVNEVLDVFRGALQHSMALTRLRARLRQLQAMAVPTPVVAAMNSQEASWRRF